MATIFIKGNDGSITPLHNFNLKPADKEPEYIYVPNDIIQYRNTLTFTSSGYSTVIFYHNDNLFLYKFNSDPWKLYVCGSTILLFDGDSVKFKSYAAYQGSLYGSKFKFTGNIKISGNIMSLIDQSCQNTTVPDNCFLELFAECDNKDGGWYEGEYDYIYEYILTATVDISDLKLPATTLGKHAYHGMFWGCRSITKAPELPATDIGSFAYKSMFDQCSSLEFPPPALPAEALAEACYFQMFLGCTKLKTIPDIKATTLDKSCCGLMFKDCSSLGDLSHFELLATTPPTGDAVLNIIGCYQGMFYNCANLTHTPYVYISTTIYNGSVGTIHLMFAECKSLKFVYLPNCTLNEIQRSRALIGSSDVSIRCKDGLVID